MAKSPRLYQRLTRSSASLGAYHSLWMAPDHLLLVTSTGYTEDYRRVDFAKIQGIFIVDSSRRNSWMIAWLVLATLSGVIVIAGFVAGSRPVVSWIFLGIALLGLVWNHLLGPSCRVHLITAVQTIRLPGLVRRRKTLRVLQRLEPVIEEAQREYVAAETTPAATAQPPPPL